MKYIDVKEASAKWGISDRRIRLLCTQGRIDGAIKLGWSWTFPADTPKPRDGRVLRRYRTVDIRPGNVDVEAIDNLKLSHPVDSSLYDSAAFRNIIRESVETLLSYDEAFIDDRDVRAILAGRVVPSVPLELHLAILNFRSVLFSQVRNKERWCEKDLRDMRVRLMQGIDDENAAEYRKGYAVYPPRDGENPAVPDQMETVLMQYENSWRNMHPVISAVLLYAAMLRVVPYEDYKSMFSYLVLSGELLRNGILPPLFSKGDAEEAKAAFLLAAKRGNYEDFTHFIERKIHDSYKALENV